MVSNPNKMGSKGRKSRARGEDCVVRVCEFITMSAQHSISINVHNGLRSCTD